MIDLLVKSALVSCVALWLTRRATPPNAQAAQRIWMVALLVPVLWMAGRMSIEPGIRVEGREDVWPAVLMTPGPAITASLLWTYVLVSIALLVRVAIGVRDVWRMIAAASPLDEDARARLAAVAPAGAYDIREGDLPVPLTAGFVRPVILLPRDWRGLDSVTLAAIVRHEAAHVTRRDGLAALLCAVLEAIAWFNPFTWLASSRARWFAEVASDARAARQMGNARYAEALIALATRWGTISPARLSPSAASGVTRRLGVLLDEIERPSRRRRLLPVAAVLLVILIAASSGIAIGEHRAAPTINEWNTAADHEMHHGHP